MDGNMNVVLRRIAFATGIVLLLISIHWSQDGFSFNVAGDSGGTSLAILIGYTLAFAVTVVQFVFSTNLKELNASLIVFGLVAYVYSIYTNYEGIVHFQGSQPNKFMAWILGFAMDGVPEPLIAWGMMESLSGDFVGNMFRAFGNFLTGKPINNGNGHGHKETPATQNRPSLPIHQKGSQGRPAMPFRPQSPQKGSGYKLEDFLKRTGLTVEDARERFADRQKFKDFASSKFHQISGQNMNEIHQDLMGNR